MKRKPSKHRPGRIIGEIELKQIFKETLGKSLYVPNPPMLLDDARYDFLQYETHAGDIAFSIDQRTGAEEPELFTSVHIDRIPLRKFLEINTDIQAILRNYGKLNKRNKKKDLPHLRKHAMHLVRLYLMGIDILKGVGIQTYREKEHDLLMGIRSGDVPFDEVFHLVDGYEKEIEQAYRDSPLPDKPDEEAINNMLVHIYREYL
ncbi:hypothetical protein [uncultured Selenomonas sp.]|uniref:hypothetical protein n=1 Tax=uncultured Selenomonas sp. TaxID=159275 RepID=UPI0026007509|nr:hypothetical protein [uncultured Selenomonas sp.]